MSKAAKSDRPPYEIDTAGLRERIPLEAELVARNSELRNFSVIRDRLVAFGKDANAAYREILARRDTVAAKLRALRTPTSASPLVVASPRPNLPLFDAPIAPAKFRPPIVGGIPFGYSGVVQAGPLSNGINVVPGGDTSGEIITSSIGSPTYVLFNGSLKAGPTELPPGEQYDPTIRYFWLRNWQVLVPFPAPSTLAQLTDRFSVGAEFDVFSDGVGTVMSFVSVGETANLTGNVAITTDAGWPLIADLSQPAEYYNGSYGALLGQTMVQRTFVVGSGHVPAVAIAVGAVVGLPMGAEVGLTFFLAGSGISIYGSEDYLGEYVGGKIAYHVQPELIAEQIESTA
jgi:hypothetical protein